MSYTEYGIYGNVVNGYLKKNLKKKVEKKIAK